MMNIGSELQIACTQPRRLAATELASRVADEMGVVLGEEVGYQIGGVSMINKNKQKKTRLAYMTEGVLLRQLSMDRQTLLHHYEARTRRKIKISSHDSRRQTKSYFSSKLDSITFVPCATPIALQEMHTTTVRHNWCCLVFYLCSAQLHHSRQGARSHTQFHRLQEPQGDDHKDQQQPLLRRCWPQKGSDPRPSQSRGSHWNHLNYIPNPALGELDDLAGPWGVFTSNWMGRKCDFLKELT